MFTGIVDHTGTVQSLEKNHHGLSLKIHCQFTDLQEGESIAVNGCCLTALNPQANLFACDLSPETLSVTNLSELKLNSSVNLERAMRLSDRLGGHMVMGHVDKTCQIQSITPEGDFIAVKFSGILPAEHCFLVKKGCVAINGVSLTINDVSADGFSVMIIPHTQKITNLIDLKVADRVNIEYDWLIKTVVNQLQSMDLNRFKKV